MKSANKVITEDEKAAIEQAVSQAETKTSGEIVPVIATVSSDYTHASYLFGFCLSLIVTIALWCCLPNLSLPSSAWSSELHTGPGLSIVILTQLVSFIIGTWLAQVLPGLKLFFISKKEMALHVERRAMEAFFKLGVRHTAGATGVVIYVSLYEHMVRVQGDDAITKHVQDEQWQDICNSIISAIKAGQLAEGLKQGIEKSGEMLATHFPVQAGDTNELANKLNFM